MNDAVVAHIAHSLLDIERFRVAHLRVSCKRSHAAGPASSAGGCRTKRRSESD